MKLNLKIELYDHKHDPINLGTKEDSTKKIAMVGHIAVEALLANHPANAQLSGEVKAQRWNLAKKVSDYMSSSEEMLDLSVEQVKEIKDQIGICFPIPVVGPCMLAIEEGKNLKLVLV